MTLGQRIESLRQSQNLSKRQLALKSNITPGYLSHLENDKSKNPSMEILCRLAVTLKTTLQFLCHGKTDIDFEQLGELPEGMQDFIDKDGKRLGIQNEDIIDLMGMKYRGNSPHTAEGWAYLHSSIKLVIDRNL